MENTFDTGLGNTGRKATVAGVILAFHVLLVLALVSSLSTIIVDRLPPIIKAEIIEEIAQEDEPPRRPCHRNPAPYVPPDILIDLPVDAPVTSALTRVSNVPKPPPAEVKPGIKKPPEIDPKFKRRFQPDYPPTSRRLGEAGSVVLQVLVGPDGSVQDGKVKTSSGYPRLDEAALKHRPPGVAIYSGHRRRCSGSNMALGQSDFQDRGLIFSPGQPEHYSR